MINKRDIILIAISVFCSLGIFYLLYPVNNNVEISESNAWSKFVNDEFPNEAPANGNIFVKAARIGNPAVVRIAVKNSSYEFWNESGPVVSAGSGVMISIDGYIVTNHHVLAAGNKFEVTTADKKKYIATLTGSDESTDIAVLKIDKTYCPYLTMANSDSVQVGQYVIAIGNPYQLNSTVTSGIVSAKGRTIDLLKGEYPLESFIQTDAVFNEGNSGGALINAEGELIGVNTAIFTKSGKFEGYSFAIPSNIVRKMVSDIISYGKVQRAMLGVGIEDITDRLGKKIGAEPESGVYVNRVSKSSAAEKSGLKSGDIITGINGVPVYTYPHLQEQIALFKPGDIVNVTYNRSGKNFSTEIKLTSPVSPGNVIIRSDKELRPLGLELREGFGKGLDAGVVVHSITSKSQLNTSGMRSGFIIMEINGVDINTVEEMINEINKNSTQLLFKGIYPDSDKTYQYKFIRPSVGM